MSTKRQPRVTISGSFSKHWPEIERAQRELSDLGAHVLSPARSHPSSEESGFVFLASDRGSAAELERRHLDAIDNSDALYVVNPGGYLGKSTAFEIGYALARGLPVFASHTFASPPHDALIATADPASIVIELKHERVQREFEALRQTQEYIRQVAAVRGFANETPLQVLALLVEEVGEVARALRKEEGVATDRNSRLADLSEELADSLVYIMHLANQTGVDLPTALRDKESANAQRAWFMPMGNETHRTPREGSFSTVRRTVRRVLSRLK